MAPDVSAGDQLMGIPTDYRALADYLEAHVESEEQALRGYEDLLDGRPDDIATYLISLILRDEERHHKMFADMHESLESRIHLRAPGSHVPQPRIRTDAEALLRTTEGLLRAERADAKQLKALQHAWRRDTDERQLWALMVETARLDTKKHIKILRYLRTLLRESRDGARG